MGINKKPLMNCLQLMVMIVVMTRLRLIRMKTKLDSIPWKNGGVCKRCVELARMIRNETVNYKSMCFSSIDISYCIFILILLKILSQL